MADIVILGAGLTGLATAYHLEQKGITSVAVYEKHERPGGLLKSVTKQGFTFDYTGHLLHINDNYFKQFLITVAQLNEQFDYVQRKAAIYTHGVMTHYPFQMNLFGMPADLISECLKGFLARKTSMKKPRSFYDWVIKYFGSGFARHFFTPYNNKLLACSIKNITPSWTGRFVPKTSIDALIEGAVLDRHAGSVGYNSCFYYPKQGGIEFVIKQLVKNLSLSIHTGWSAQSIDIKKKIVYFANGEKVSYRYLISTMPLDLLLGSLIEPSTSSLGSAADKLLCNSVINMNIGFKGTVNYDKHWIYFPEKKYTFYRMGLWHTICKQLAPEGHASIYAETSYLKHKTSAKQLQNLLKKTREQAFTFMGKSFDESAVEETLMLNHAYVLYDHWREQNLPSLLNRLRDEDIYSIGRFGAWKYSSMQEAVLEGQEIAQLLSGLMGQDTSAKMEAWGAQ